MEKYSKNLRTIAETLTYFILIIGVTSIENKVFSYCYFGIWGLFGIYNIYYKIRYKKGKFDLVHFPTKNDNFYKSSFIIIGAAIFICSFLAIFWSKELNQYIILGNVIGMIILINGLLEIPRGELKITDQTLTIYGISGKKASVSDDKIVQIVISKDQIEIIDSLEKTTIINHLNLDSNAASSIEKYIKTHFKEVQITRNI